MPIVALSVVVASFRERGVLDECLGALRPQTLAPDVEVVVVRAAAGDAIEQLTRDHSVVRVVPMPVGSTLPQLRGRGLAAASGRVVALTEDNCIVGAHWVETIRRATAGCVDVMGGGLDNGQQQRAVDCGAFLAEYGMYSALTPPHDASPVSFTAANAAYSRRVVPDVADWMRDGAWENVVHDRLRARGAVFAFEPAARVAQNLRHSFFSFLMNRYHHGRDYARGRVAESPSINRWLRGAGTPLLAPLLTYRVARIATGSSERTLTFLRALPFTLVFFAAWAAGEAAGYFGTVPSRSTAP